MKKKKIAVLVMMVVIIGIFTGQSVKGETIDYYDFSNVHTLSELKQTVNLLKVDYTLAVKEAAILYKVDSNTIMMKSKEEDFNRYGLLYEHSNPNSQEFRKLNTDNGVLKVKGGVYEYLGYGFNGLKVKNPEYKVEVSTGNALDEKSNWLYWKNPADSKKMRESKSYKKMFDDKFPQNKLIENNKQSTEPITPLDHTLSPFYGTGVTTGKELYEKIYTGIAIGFLQSESLTKSSRFKSEMQQALTDYQKDGKLEHFTEVKFLDTRNSPARRISLTDAFIIQSLPTQNNVGRAFTLRYSNQTKRYYYWYITIPPLKTLPSNPETKIKVEPKIEIATIAKPEELHKEGSFVFTYTVENAEAESYTITKIEGASLKNPKEITGRLTGKKGKKSIQIKANTMVDQHIVMEVEVENTKGKTDKKQAKATIWKQKAETTPTGNTSSESETKQSYMHPRTEGVLQADIKGSEKFAVEEGIPSSESLYTYVDTDQYLYELGIRQKKGKINYEVKFQVIHPMTWYEWDPKAKLIPEKLGTKEVVDEKTKKVTRVPYVIEKARYEGDWKEKNGTSDPVPYSYIVEREYSYQYIENFALYEPTKAIITNEALPGKSVSLYQRNYKRPQVEIKANQSFTAHTQLPFPKNTVLDLGVKTGKPLIAGKGEGKPTIEKEESRYKSEVESKIGQIKVKNDVLAINGVKILEESWQEKVTKAPGKVPAPEKIGENIFTAKGMRIPDTVKNGEKTTTGKIIYTRREDIERKVTGNTTGEKVKEYEIKGKGRNTINEVVVHTPVVCYPSIKNIVGTNQLINPDESKEAFQIESTFTLRYPYEGEHTSKKGYGNRSYKAYTKKRQVKFSFDVIIGNDYTGTHVEAWEWIDFNEGEIEKNFFLPTWTNEGEGRILFRTIPINLEDITSQAYERKANKSLENYKAVTDQHVEISGNIQNFRITNSADDFWHEFFAKDLILSAGKEAREENHRKSQEEIEKELGLENINKKYIEKNQVLPLSPGKSDSIYEKVRKEVTQNSKYRLKGYEQNRAIQLGYPIYFEVETTGDMETEEESLYIVPEYSYVPMKKDKTPDMSKRVPVEIYVETGRYLKKLEETEDFPFHDSIYNNQHKYSESYINQSYEGTKYIKTMYANEGNTNERNANIGNISQERINQEKVNQNYRDYNQNGKYDEEDYRGEYGSSRRSIGTGKEIELIYKDKGFIGDIEAAKETKNMPYSENKVLTSKQKWGGMLYLPNRSLFVEKGKSFGKGSIDIDKAPFVHDGYIIVNFKIYRLKERNNKDTKIQEYGNMWKTEGYDENQLGGTLETGDIVFYYTDKRASSTYR